MGEGQADTKRSDKERDAALREALSTVCPESAAIEMLGSDPGSPPEYTVRPEDWGDGLEARATCSTDNKSHLIDAYVYEGTHPSADMEDIQDTMKSADGSPVSWAIKDLGSDQWIAVLTNDYEQDWLAPLVDDGYERLGDS